MRKESKFSTTSTNCVQFCCYELLNLTFNCKIANLFCYFLSYSWCLSPFASLSDSVSLSPCRLPVSVCLSACLPACLPVCLSVYLSIYLSLHHLSVSPSLHLSISPSLHLSVSPSLRLSVSPSLQHLSISLSHSLFRHLRHKADCSTTVPRLLPPK
jgi:hypothetical protein